MECGVSCLGGVYGLGAVKCEVSGLGDDVVCEA